ncbi:MAG: AarF/ABC1/UbiB kinase family protein [Planctomycetes bacterium]|nr:AarF/ABC1/UbiB kinase family protein [Planctomycetota bacterium]
MFSRFDRNAKRVGEILAILGRYGLADWLSGLSYEWIHGRLVSFDGERLGKLTQEARIRLALTELGTTFIKLGQMLSTRADLVGPSLAEELALLRSHTPPDPPEKIREIIRADLGQPVDALFIEFNDRPLASASIGQVHQATLSTGEKVVVKVQHDGIEQKILGDLDIMGVLADLAQKHVSYLRAYQPTATLREFRRTLLNELDFSSEKRNLQDFAGNFAKDKHVHFPKVFPDRCSRRVLTMEMLVGVSGEDVPGLKASGFDLEEFAQRGAGMYLDMIFRDGFYHADPHPGNLMMLPGGVVGVLDCGMVGRLDDTMREEVEALLLSIINKDAVELTDTVMRLGAVPPDLDRDTLRAEISNFVSEHGSRSLRDFNLSVALKQMTDIVRRYHILLPSTLALMLKTLVMLEGTSRMLNPNFNLAALIEPYQVKVLKHRLSLDRLFKKLYRTYRDWDRLIDMLPRDLAEILRRVRNGTFEMRHEHHRLESTINRLVMGILTASFFLGSSVMLAHKVEPAPGDVSIIGAIGMTLSMAFAYKLIRAINKADDADKKK